MKKHNGYVLYRGPSLLDGAPIVVIATIKTDNPKTGDMVQTWILREDIAPHKAIKSGDDYSICGDCIHRPSNLNTCYVTTFQAPLAVFNAFHRGSYSYDLDEFRALLPSRKLRIGAYGDPAAAPTELWLEFAGLAIGHTGYTHQWMRDDFDSRLLGIVMASIDTPEQAKKAPGRYFRVLPIGAKPLPREVECLSDSVGKACADCLLCDGGQKGKSVYINAHGARAKNYTADLIAVSA